MQNISVSRPADTIGPASVQLHGVLVRVHDVGVLLIGESGTGKSDCALWLVLSGHHLVADDAVKITVEDGRLVGRAPELTRGLLAIRGLGIIDVRNVFGGTAFVDECEIDLCIQLLDGAGSDELKAVERVECILGHDVPKLVFARDSRQNPTELITAAVRMRPARRDSLSVASASEKPVEFAQSAG